MLLNIDAWCVEWVTKHVIHGGREGGKEDGSGSSRRRFFWLSPSHPRLWFHISIVVYLAGPGGFLDEGLNRNRKKEGRSP